MKMSETARLARFGIHSVTFFDRDTGEVLTRPLEILGEASVDLGGESVKLFGGSNLFPWTSKVIRKNGSVKLAIKEVTPELIALINGTTPTINEAEASGAIEDLDGVENTATNKKGTSIIKATTGIASVNVTSGEESDLKSGVYYIKATSSTGVSVYAYSDVDFATGADGAFLDDSALIAENLTITTNGNTKVENYGITLTGGSGTISFTIGDTAVFVVRKINKGNFKVPIGSDSIEQKQFGMLITGARQENGNVEYWYFHKCTISGGTFPLPETEFGVVDVTVDVLYDDVKGEVGFYNYIKA